MTWKLQQPNPWTVSRLACDDAQIPQPSSAHTRESTAVVGLILPGLSFCSAEIREELKSDPRSDRIESPFSL